MCIRAFLPACKLLVYAEQRTWVKYNMQHHIAVAFNYLIISVLLSNTEIKCMIEGISRLLFV